jgi:signal peptidase II
VFAVVASITLVADLISKRLVLSALLPQERIELLPFLALQRTSNRGVAFGLLSGRMSLIIAAAAVSMVVVVLYFLLEPRPVLGGLAGGFLLGGSLGNMVERVTAGSVTDFLKIPHYPTFNLADIFIVVGVLLVALSVLLGIPERESGAKES